MTGPLGVSICRIPAVLCSVASPPLISSAMTYSTRGQQLFKVRLYNIKARKQSPCVCSEGGRGGTRRCCRSSRPSTPCAHVPTDLRVGGVRVPVRGSAFRCSGCCHRTPQTGWLINNRNLSPSWRLKSKIKAPAWWGPSSGHTASTFPLCPPVMEGVSEFWGVFYKNTHPTQEGSVPKASPFSHRRVRRCDCHL